MVCSIMGFGKKNQLLSMPVQCPFAISRVEGVPIGLRLHAVGENAVVAGLVPGSAAERSGIPVGVSAEND